MRIFPVLFFVLISHAAIADWLTYPADLPQFDYSGERLQQHWSLLNQGTAQPWPDEHFLTDMLDRYPGLKEYSLGLANQPGAHPALLALQQNDLSPLAEATQNVWRLHYQGQFRQAYELGMQLGPAGAVPALYSKLMYAALLVTDKEQKLALFRDHFGVPYTDADIQGAGEAVKGKTELEALIAYLQSLGHALK